MRIRSEGQERRESGAHPLREGEETGAQREGRGKWRDREGRLRVRERSEETLSYRIYIQWVVPGRDGLSVL